MNLQIHSWPSVNLAKIPEQVLTSIVGNSCDDRGISSIDWSRAETKQCLEMSVNIPELSYSLLGIEYALDDLSPILKLLSSGSLLIDTTTLGFQELFLCLKAARESKQRNFWLLYVEPAGYKSKRGRGVIHKRDFELSSRSDQFIGVPGSVIMMLNPSAIRTVIVMGYESGRLQQILEQFPELCSRCDILLGVPAFQAGWEMNAYANVVDQIENKNIPGVLFAGAANPLRTYQELQRVYNSKNKNDRFLIVPIGTKPHGIGVALFAAEHQDVGLMYDNPERKEGRSEKVGACHLYQCSF